MTWTRVLRAVVVFAVLVTLHYTLRPLLGWRAPVDFLVVAVLLTAVRVRAGTAAVVGFLARYSSKATVAAYALDLRLLFEWCAAQGVDPRGNLDRHANYIVVGFIEGPA